MITMMTMTSPLGELRLYERAHELIALALPDRPAPSAPERRSDVGKLAAAQLAEYFAGKRHTFELPLAPEGTAFQQLVWRALLAIPYGATCSYGDIARAIGRPAASRAVGAANGKNPIAIIVPCHRVIGANGDLTGYGGGMPAKKLLLELESSRAGQAARGTLWFPGLRPDA